MITTNNDSDVEYNAFVADLNDKTSQLSDISESVDELTSTIQSGCGNILVQIYTLIKSCNKKIEFLNEAVSKLS